MAMDSTRSWVVAASSGWIMLFNFAIIRSAAVFYVIIIESFDVTREDASWPLNLAVVLTNCAGPLAGVLSRYVAIWKLLLVTSAMNSLAVSACCFARNVGHLTILLGVVHGSSNAFTGLCYTVINQHFYRYRTVASGIGNAGVALGGLIFAPLAQFLFEEFGARGAFILCGAVMLHATMGALLLRLLPEVSETPPCTYGNAARSQVLQESHERVGLPDADFEFDRPLGFERLHDARIRNAMKVGDGDQRSDVIIDLKRDKDPPLASAEFQNTSRKLRNLHSFYEHCLGESKGPARNTGHSFGLSNPANDTSTSLPSDGRNGHLLSILKYPKFYLICFSFSIVYMNMTTYLSNIIDLAKDRNVDDWNAVLLVTIYAIGDLSARLVSGIITDKGFLQKSSMMAAIFVVWTAVMCLAPFCSSYHLHVIVSLTSGWCTGTSVVLIPVIFMDLVHPAKFSITYGLMCLSAGLVLLGRPALIGCFRDRTGDYRGMFLIHGLLTALGAFPWLFISLREKWRNHAVVVIPKAKIAIKTISREYFRKENNIV